MNISRFTGSEFRGHYDLKKGSFLDSIHEIEDREQQVNIVCERFFHQFGEEITASLNHTGSHGRII